jgi:anion-transporting  ArsA/GET3 family ATPase
VVANELIQKNQVGADAVEFVRKRIQMQEEHMAEIWNIFTDRVRALVPLFESEIKGPKMLNRLVQHLFEA